MLNSESMSAALAALRDAGLLADSIEFDGVLHRVPTRDKPNSKNGAYIAYGDAPASLWWQDWASGESGTWTAKGEGKLTATERDTLARRMIEARAKREEEQARVQAESAEKAKAIYAAATECAGHAYLTSKGVTSCHELKLHKGAVVVPLRDDGGNIVSLQFIDTNGNKRFLTGGRKKGCFFAIRTAGGKDADKALVICEGLATGLSLLECLGYPVLVAFDAGNLLPVAELARARYPEREIILAADNDTATDGNPGLTKATAAALAVGGSLATPRWEGRAVDWNDLHREMGAETVKEQFKPTKPTEPTNETAEAEQESRILPPPPPVPLGAFPSSVAAMLEEAAQAFTVPLQIPAACFLSLLSCLVGRARQICLKESWKEAGNLWLAVVAQSGMGKSPLISAFFNVVDRLEYEAKKAFDAEYAEYEDLLLERQTQRTHNARAKARGKDFDAGPVPLPDEPAQRQVTADDVTVEALGEILKGNPKGVLWLKDELSGMLFDLDKYSSNGGGGTKARLLSSYDCKRWKTNRTSNPKRNIDIPKACVSIFGGIQPGMLTKAFEAGTGGTDEESGFLPRFIFIRAVAEAPGYWNERTFSRASMDLLDTIAAALWAWDIEHDAESREVERIVPVSRQAKTLYIQWYNAIAEQAFISDNAALLAKLRGQAQRLCLLLHCLDAALAGTDGMGFVTEDCMRRALLLADWIQEHQAQCWRFFRPEEKAKQADPIERAIMAVVVEQAARIEADRWKISNADLCSLVEAKLNMPGLSAAKIGKAASGLGLPACWVTPKSKGRIVTQDNILSFKTTVGSVGCRSATTISGNETTVGHPLVTVGSDLPAWAQPTDTNGSPTVPLVEKAIAAVGQPAEPAEPTDGSGYSFDFNDPNFPDEVII